MNRILVSAAVAVALTTMGAACAQQATTGQNQSNPNASQQSGPVGTTGAPMNNADTRSTTPNANTGTMGAGTMNNPPASAGSTTRTTPSSGATDMSTRGERPARADRN